MYIKVSPFELIRSSRSPFEKKTVLKDFDHQNLLCCFKKSFQICLNFCRSCIWDLIVAFVLSQIDNSFYESCAHFASNAASSFNFCLTFEICSILNYFKVFRVLALLTCIYSCFQ